MRIHDVIIVGAGQAGLGLSWRLTQSGVDHLLLEKGEIGRAWREDRWDSFCLVTPNWTITLPGAEYAGDAPDGFMTGKAFIDHLDAWAASFNAPVRTMTEATALRRTDGAFLLETSRGPFRARQVVLATATYQRPRLPPFAGGIAGEIQQLHASRYRNPDALPAGGALVVGSGQSGCQIAEELAAAGRETFLAIGRAGRLPRRHRGRDCIAWQRDMGWLDRTPDMLADPALRFRGDPHLTGADGGRTLSLHDLAATGVVLLGGIADVDPSSQGAILQLRDDLADGLAVADAYARDFRRSVDQYIAAAGLAAPPPTLAELSGEPPTNGPALFSPEKFDLRARGVSTIIWATGFEFDFGWVDLPVFDRFGYPDSNDGATGVPGLYCMGLNWLPKRKSGIIFGVAEDSAKLAARLSAQRPAEP